MFYSFVSRLANDRLLRKYTSVYANLIIFITMSLIQIVMIIYKGRGHSLFQRTYYSSQNVVYM